MTTLAHELDTDPRWQRVLARDSTADGEFVFAVRTTGIYCRPSCPARRPRPGNVRFFGGPSLARAAGFRACLRCMPDSARDEPHGATVRLLAARLADPEPPSLSAIARDAGLSTATLTRAFERATGVTPRAYLAARRAERAENALRRASSVSAAMYDAGYRSRARFHDDTSDRLAMSPSLYRAGGLGLEVRYAIGRCTLGPRPMGHVLVATTERGVCAILLGDDRVSLERELEARMPRATRTDATDALRAELSEVVRLAADPSHATHLPLDVRGTAFQARVWRALREIPAGQTRSYVEIARAIGAPASARAVGRACASNPLAMAIPCHRAVSSSGALTGYRWGLDRKAALLTSEQAAAAPESPRRGRDRPRRSNTRAPNEPSPPRIE